MNHNTKTENNMTNDKLRENTRQLFRMCNTGNLRVQYCVLINDLARPMHATEANVRDLTSYDWMEYALGAEREYAVGVFNVGTMRYAIVRGFTDGKTKPHVSYSEGRGGNDDELEFVVGLVGDMSERVNHAETVMGGVL